jgi:hypothetical protein
MPYCPGIKQSGKEMRAHRRVIGPIFTATHLSPLSSRRIPFKEALLWVKNSVYFHHIAQYRYHAEATIIYMKSYLEIACHKDVRSQFRDKKSTKKGSQALKKELTLNEQEKRLSDSTWKDLSAAAMSCRVHEDSTQIK